MKNHYLPGVCLAILFCVFSVRPSLAQDKVPLNEPDYSKPHLFDNLPAIIPADLTDLSVVLNAAQQKNQDIMLPLKGSKTTAFSGRISYAVKKEQHQLTTVTVRSSNFSGAVLTLTSFTEENGTINYIGRIISRAHGDAYELEKRSNHYYWIKKNLYEMMAE